MMTTEHRSIIYCYHIYINYSLQLYTCTQPIMSVLGNYAVEVHVQSYSNPTNRCQSCYTEYDQLPGCCDDFTVQTCTGELRCDNKFTYCLRPHNTPPDTEGCSGYIGTIRSSVNQNGGQLDFSQPRLLGLPNPLRLQGLRNISLKNAWQVSKVSHIISMYI